MFISSFFSISIGGFYFASNSWTMWTRNGVRNRQMVRQRAGMEARHHEPRGVSTVNRYAETGLKDSFLSTSSSLLLGLKRFVVLLL